MKKWIIALLVILGLVSEASAVAFNKLPCTPIFLAGPQGRPLPDTNVASVLTVAGLSASGIWYDPAGTTAFNNRVPSSQILQFYADDAGVYQVMVTASGSVKSYWTICGYGVGSLTTTEYRDAQALQPWFADEAPIYVDSTSFSPPYWEMSTGHMLFFGFKTPDQGFSFASMTLVSHTSAVSANCSATWTVNMCSFANGAAVCSIASAVNTATQAMMYPNVVGRRMDVIFTSATWPLFVWTPGDEVFVSITLTTASCANVPLYGVELEFNR